MTNKSSFILGLGLVLALVGPILGFAGRAHAQSATSGAIQGVVSDAATGEPFAGVTVVATSPALQGTQSAFTDGAGQYKITNLPPGTYSVTFYYADVTVRRTNIVVSINKTTPTYVKIDTAQAGGEIITIEDKAPAIDPTSTTQGVTLDQDYTRNIPVAGRTYEDVLGAAAGASGDDLGVGFSGSTSLENQYIVDGVNTTSLQFGMVGAPLLNDFLEEVEVITGGYNAEYGRATGGVVNVVTKSGSNEFHGGLFTYVTPGFLTAAYEATPSQSASIDSESNLRYDADFGFDLGGPILKDKIWFYVGFAPQMTSENVDRVTKRRTDCRTVLPDGTLSPCDQAAYGDGIADEDPSTGFLVFDELGRDTLKQSSTSYQLVSKLNFAVAPEHQGQISFVGSPSSGNEIGIDGLPSATRFDYEALTTDVSGKWTSKLNGNKTEIEGLVGWHRSSYKLDPTVAGANDMVRQNLYYGDLGHWGMLGGESAETVAGCTDSGTGDRYPQITNCPDEGVGYSIGGTGDRTDLTEERLYLGLAGTQRVTLAGTHEFKGGVDLENNSLVTLREMSGGMYFDVYLGEDDARTEAWRYVKLAPDGNPDNFTGTCNDTDREEMHSCEFLGGNDVTSATVNWGAYLRDSWQLMPNLTFNYGLRYEEQRMRYAADLQNTVDPFTGETLGTNAVVMKNMWAPRLGAVYDWTKEGRSKVYASWGRFYESIPLDMNKVNFGGQTTFLQVFKPDQCGEVVDGVGGAAGPGCLTTGEEPGTSNIFGSGILTAPGIKPQYQDETVLGAEYELMEDLKVGVALQNRRLGRVVEDVSPDGTETYILANPGEWSKDEEQKLVDQIAASDDTAEMERLQHKLDLFRTIRRFDTPERNYNALQLTASKRFSKQLLVQASYTYSRTSGNFPGLYSPDSGQLDPNITAQYDLIELLANRDGLLPQDRPHYFKVDGYYIFDFGKIGQLVTGARVRALSGTPIDALGSNYLYGFDESYVLPRGSMGRTSFDGGLDVHLSYGRQISKDMSFEIFTDVFNVFNRQGVAAVDESYTHDAVNPIVGGSYEDLVFAKAQDVDGNEPDDPTSPLRNRNFRNAKARYEPLMARLGARLTF